MLRPASGVAAAISRAPLVPAKPSIAVLPFDNLSGDSEQQYFSDGIAGDIINDLSRLSDLFVITRYSAFAFTRFLLADFFSTIGTKATFAWLETNAVRWSAFPHCRRRKA